MVHLHPSDLGQPRGEARREAGARLSHQGPQLLSALGAASMCLQGAEHHPLPRGMGSGFPALAGHRLLVPTFSTGNFTSEAHLPSHHSAPHPSLSPHLWFPLLPLPETPPVFLESGRGDWSPLWPLGMDASWLWSQAPHPSFAKMGWSLQSGEEPGRPAREGMSSKPPQWKVHLPPHPSAVYQFDGVLHPDMKRGLPLATSIEEGPK